MAGFSRTVTLPVLLLVFFFFISFSEGRDYLIGGKPNAWTIPTSESDSLNHWAQKSRFLIGDSLGTFIHSFFNHIKVSPFSSSSTSKAQSHLFFFSLIAAVWQYDASIDSVLQVTKRDYVTCNTSSPIETYTGGSTKVELDKSGPHYFISGAQGHCEKGQKLIVVVISEKHSRFKGVSPAPSPTEIEAPAVAPAPASGATSFTGGFSVLSLVVAALGYSVMGL